jgi:predicted esterase
MQPALTHLRARTLKQQTVVQAICSFILLSAIVAHAETTPRLADDEIRPQQCVVVGSVGRYGRTAAHIDAVQDCIAAGKWRSPKAGDELQAANGKTLQWQTLDAGEDGSFQHPALNGGYASMTVGSDRDRVMLLSAAGHSMVYVNGEPRVGDGYETSYVLLPILLHKGTNELLFQCTRGTLRAKLSTPALPFLFNIRDCTLPDIVAHQPGRFLGAVVVINAACEPLEGLSIQSSIEEAEATATPLPTMLPASVFKAGFEFVAPEIADGAATLKLSLVRGDRKTVLHQVQVPLRVRKPEQSRRITFRSEIDGSVQYYALQPASSTGEQVGPPALFLSLHGAGVEAMGQADAYAAKPWGHVVAATNRRPFGFDWEDWGRLDALEVLELAQGSLKTDPRRTYLIGHSMGGHGVWSVGTLYSDRFAAVGPSAGWLSFWSYGAPDPYPDAGPVEAIMKRATAASDTLERFSNTAQYGVYVLHGDKDDTVPVEQARSAVKRLGEFHRDFAYHEVVGAGHWWSNEAVDFPPLFDFLQRHVAPEPGAVRHVAFVTPSPGVSSACHWVGVDSQVKQLESSSVDLVLDPDSGRLIGTTVNVAGLTLKLGTVKPTKDDVGLSIRLDDQQIADDLPWPADDGAVYLSRNDDKWSLASPPSPSHKRPRRCGPFKSAFNNRVMLVYGSKGNPQENAWALAKARYDSEAFWYRGNASFEVLADMAFDAAETKGRNVVLYGNADTNSAWKVLLADSPVQVRRGRITLGSRQLEGDGLGCLLVRPRPDDDVASVGAVTGSGLQGMRLTDRLPYFVSGVGYPDCAVFGPDTLRKGSEGIIAAGFFGNDWSIENGDFAWRD